MSDIKFYDFDFNLLHAEPFAESANYTVKFCGEGSFELHFPRNFEAKRELMKNIDIKNGKGICIVNGKRNGIVTGIRIDNDFAVYGKTCDFILRKKVVLPFENSESYDPYTLCSNFVSTAFADTEKFIVKESDETFENITSESFEQDLPQTLYDTVCGILSDNGLGYAVNFVPSLKKWVFEILKPSDTGNKFVCDEATAYDISLSLDTKEYFSHILSKNDNGDYEFLAKHNTSGLYRWEEISKQSEDLMYDLNFKFINNKFEKDYFLGDKFKVFTENGIFSAMVSEVSLSYEGNIAKESPKLKISEEVEN